MAKGFRKIFINGEEINLYNCLKKDRRSYYDGSIYLESGTDKYAEFECIPEGMLIRLTDSPRLTCYHVKNLDGRGVFSIPSTLFNLYKMDRVKSALLYQLDQDYYFLAGRLRKAERENFKAPINKELMDPKDKIDFSSLVRIHKFDGQTIPMKECVRVKIDLHFGKQIYAKIQVLIDENYDKYYTLREIKQRYGMKLQHFSGSDITFVSNTYANGVLYFPKMFYRKSNISSSKCVLYFNGSNTYYISPKITYSDITGKEINYMDSAPELLMIEESTSKTVLEALFEEVTEFTETAGTIFTDYQHLKKENEEIKEMLSKAIDTINKNNEKGLETFPELLY